MISWVHATNFNIANLKVLWYRALKLRKIYFSCINIEKLDELRNSLTSPDNSSRPLELGQVCQHVRRYQLNLGHVQQNLTTRNWINKILLLQKQQSKLFLNNYKLSNFIESLPACRPRRVSIQWPSFKIKKVKEHFRLRIWYFWKNLFHTTNSFWVDFILKIFIQSVVTGQSMSK